MAPRAMAEFLLEVDPAGCVRFETPSCMLIGVLRVGARERFSERK